MKYPELMASDSAVNTINALNKIREQDPIHWVDSPRVKMWFVSSYNDIQQLLSDDRVGVKAPQTIIQHLPAEKQQELDRLYSHLCNAEKAFTPYFRQQIQSFFTPKAIRKLGEKITAMVDEILCKVDHSKPIDIVDVLSKPLPAYVIADIFGAPAEDFDQFVPWSAQMIRVFREYDFEAWLDAQAGFDAMTSYCKGLLDKFIENPEDNLLSHLAHTALKEGFTEEELLACASGLLMAGHETTTILISKVVRYLLQWPEVRQEIQSDESLLAPMIKEVIRYDGVSAGGMREIKESFNYKGHEFVAGQSIFMSYRAANHDSTVYFKPELFEYREKRSMHLGFGYGGHFCLGSHLAMLEVELAVSNLLSRFPKCQIADNGCEIKHMPLLNTQISKLNVILQPIRSSSE